MDSSRQCARAACQAPVLLATFKNSVGWPTGTTPGKPLRVGLDTPYAMMCPRRVDRIIAAIGDNSRLSEARRVPFVPGQVPEYKPSSLWFDRSQFIRASDMRCLSVGYVKAAHSRSAGIVYEKNLGPDTATAAGVVTDFNPDASWKVTK